MVDSTFVTLSTVTVLRVTNVCVYVCMYVRLVRLKNAGLDEYGQPGVCGLIAANRG